MKGLGLRTTQELTDELKRRGHDVKGINSHPVKWTVGIQKSLYQYIEVEADTKEQAIAKALAMVRESAWSDYNNYPSVCDCEETK